MKKFTLIVCCMLLVAAAGFAQEIRKDAPAVVLNSFEAKYPNVEVKDWKWEERKNVYEAEFKMNDKEYQAYFKADGKWVKTTRELKSNELPEVITASIGSGEYTTWNSGDRTEIETPDGKWYKVKVEKGNQTKYLKFNENGEMMKAIDKHGKKKDKKPAI